MAYVDQYPAIVAKLVSVRGSFGAVDSTGAALPAMTAQDMTALLALVFGGLKAGITKSCDLIAPVSVCDDSGVVKDTTSAGVWGHEVSVDAYLAGVGGTLGHQRTPSDAFVADVAGAYEPALMPNLIKGEETGILGFAWQAVDDYNACLVVGAGAFLSYPSGPVATNMAQTFLCSFRALCADIDTLGEASPVSLADALKGAIGAAANASAKSAGELAAAVGNAAGEVGGSFLEGFLGNAGIVSLALAGVVLYKVA